MLHIFWHPPCNRGGESKKQQIMKNSVIGILIIAMMMSTAAFGQRDAKKAQTRDSKSTRVVARTNNPRAVKPSTKVATRKSIKTSSSTNKRTATRTSTRTTTRTSTRTSTRVNNNNRTSSRNNGYYKRNKGQRVAKQVRVNRKVRKLARYNRVRHRGVSYYYNSNRFYQQRNGFYHGVAAPFGYRVNTIQAGCYSFNRGNISYYYSGGAFYNYNSAGYYTVAAPPQGAMVYDLPFGTQTLTKDGKIYYEYAGILYQKVETTGGDAYEVTGS